MGNTKLVKYELFVKNALALEHVCNSGTLEFDLTQQQNK